MNGSKSVQDEQVAVTSNLYSSISFGGGGGHSGGTSNTKTHMGRVGSLSNAEGKNVTRGSTSSRTVGNASHAAVQYTAGGARSCVGCHNGGLDPYVNTKTTKK